MKRKNPLDSTSPESRAARVLNTIAGMQGDHIVTRSVLASTLLYGMTKGMLDHSLRRLKAAKKIRLLTVQGRRSWVAVGRGKALARRARADQEGDPGHLVPGQAGLFRQPSARAIGRVRRLLRTG
jgi:hypothetical protein